MLSTQNLGVKVAVILGRGVCTVLAANLDAPIVCEIKMFYEAVAIERVEVEGGEGREHGGSDWLFGVAPVYGRPPFPTP